VLTNLFVFTKMLNWTRVTNDSIQMLLAFQVSELQYPAYTSDYKHGCQGTISKNGQTWQISKSSDFWLYVRSDTLYRKTRISTLFAKYTLLPPCDVTNPFLWDLSVTRSRLIYANRFFPTVQFNEPVRRHTSLF